jgi:hypothetical protein
LVPVEQYSSNKNKVKMIMPNVGTNNNFNHITLSRLDSEGEGKTGGTEKKRGRREVGERREPRQMRRQLDSPA